MKAIDVAKAIINECSTMGIPVTITKLHKLLYIVYGVYLIAKEKPLFNEEEDKPACYQYGPIFRSIQREYKRKNLDFNNSYNQDVDDFISDIIKIVLDNFGSYSAKALSNWSHREGSAWAKAEKEDKRYWGNLIKDEYIRDEFKDMVKIGE